MGRRFRFGRRHARGIQREEMPIVMDSDHTTGDTRPHVATKVSEATTPKGKIGSTPEGKILFLGVILTCLYIIAVGLTKLRSDDLFSKLLLMTGTHLVGGRAVSITWGFANEMNRTVVLLVSTTIETLMVLLFFPLFVFSYRKLIVIQPLQDAMARAQHAAERHQARIMKFGIPGLLLFVWFPFWMTGPLVGCVIGFLIGLRPWTNMVIVLAGTWSAILCWGIVLGNLHEQLKKLGPYVPFFLVGFVLLIAVSIRIRYAASKSNSKHSR